MLDPSIKDEILRSHQGCHLCDRSSHHPKFIRVVAVLAGNVIIAEYLVAAQVIGVRLRVWRLYAPTVINPSVGRILSIPIDGRFAGP